MRKRKKISNQRKWSKKQQEAGRCPKCGKDAGGTFLCKSCNDKWNAYRRKRYREQLKP